MPLLSHAAKQIMELQAWQEMLVFHFCKEKRLVGREDVCDAIYDSYRAGRCSFWSAVGELASQGVTSDTLWLSLLQEKAAQQSWPSRHEREHMRAKASALPKNHQPFSRNFVLLSYDGFGFAEHWYLGGVQGGT